MKAVNILCALVGMCGAVSNNGKTDRTDEIVWKALSFAALEDAEDTDRLQNIVAEIQKEKYAISPGCATCKNPCGNTSDYDASKFDALEHTLYIVKEKTWNTLLYSMKSYPYEQTKMLPELVYKVILYLGYDLAANEYEQLLCQMGELQEGK